MNQPLSVVAIALVCLVTLTLGALGLRLAAYHLLRHDLGDDPVLVLDDVFAELDSGRRERLAAMIADCEQVLITAAVPEDVPEGLAGRTYAVSLGEVSAP
mgnify:CR=1 FL=1